MNRPIVTALLGGAVGGSLDITYAVILWGFILGAEPIAIPQSIAQGLMGKAAFDGGAATALLGLALHFFIAFVMALVYVLAARRLPALITRPWLMGFLYGFILFAVMNFIVVPLSAVGWHAMKPPGFLRALAPHIFLVGPAIAAIAARAARRAKLPA